MKKKNLQLKQLKLTKETVLNMSAVTGGAPGADIKTNDCVLTVKECDTQGTVMPCCPACRSGANNTVVKQYCVIIADTVDCQIDTPMNPMG